MANVNARREISVLSVSLWLTVGFTFLSVAVALLSDSQTLMLDGVYGVVDVILYIFAIFVAKKIYEPPNEKYHFGYAKFEPFMTAVEGVLIVSICIASIMSSLQDIAHPDPINNSRAVILYALVSFFICVGFGKYMRMVAKRWHSQILMVDSEFWVQSGIISGIIFLAFGVTHFLSKTTLAVYEDYVDPVLCILFSLFLLTKPLSIIRESFFDLVDANPGKEMTATIRDFINESNKRYDLGGVKWVKIRKAGRKAFAIVSFKADDNKSVKELDLIRLNICNDASRVNQALEIIILFNRHI
ncbi:MAG: cation diffusion facilitator family transporter [Candidatus Omnitrophota bacterium]